MKLWKCIQLVDLFRRQRVSRTESSWSSTSKGWAGTPSTTFASTSTWSHPGAVRRIQTKSTVRLVSIFQQQLVMDCVDLFCLVHFLC